ncbi:MAG TPA: DJ-1/PfpI family protein [Blastocatellia bacterium]|nr:DJ-1/PfpI family protein [Blastocatellia bacterium]
MGSISLRSLLILIGLSLGTTAAVPLTKGLLTGRNEEMKEYICPPCGCRKDQETFAQSGYCPSCGMALVEKGTAATYAESRAPQEARKTVAILIFDGVQIIDYTGPYEVFGQAGFNVYTVAAKPDTITTSMGMKVTPAYVFENAPTPNVLVIPGGGVTDAQEDPATINWIRERARDAEQVMSVCNGAFILAHTGLLDGLSATTFYNLIDGLAAVAPKTRIVSDQRYVDNGKIITTAGLSSGIDGSLYVVYKIRGKAAAQMVALNMEYNWQPDSHYARANFADRYLRRIFSSRLQFAVPQGATLKVMNTQGGPDRWEVNWQVKGDATPSDVLRLLNEKLAVDGKWAQQDAQKAGSSTSAWKFTDAKGASWSGLVDVQSVAGEKGTLAVRIRINRAGIAG